MITDGLVLNDGGTAPRTFQRISLVGSTSDWATTHSNATFREAMKLVHERTGKGGATARSLASFRVERKNATTGSWEFETWSLTRNIPYVTSTLLAADDNDMKAYITNFIASASFANFLRYEP